MPVHVQSDGWFAGILPFGILRSAPFFGAEWFVTPDKPFSCCGSLCGIPFQLFGYGLRWYVGGRIPLSNGYETMQFMALCTLVLACLFRRRFPFTVPFGFLLSGFALLVAHLGQMNPQITPLMPVLVSPWLSMHVSLIMMSYALLPL